MYRLMQKYGKQILAVFSAFLMIAFAIPSTFRSGGGASGELVGKIGDERIYGNEVNNASSAWDMLSRMSLPQQRQDVEPHPFPVDMLGQAAFLQIREHPIEFLLLQKEAQRMGIAVSDDEMKSFKQNLPSFFNGDAIHNEDMQIALGQILLVKGAYDRAAGAVKVSKPAIVHALAQDGQSISLDAVQFTTAPYKAKVPPPTTQQLQAQFDQFGDNYKGVVSDKNPFGFGYKYPDRIKLQYIAIPQATVRRSIESSKSDYEWEVASQKYYFEHTSEFATTRPAGTQPTTEAASTRPTTRPFAEVKDQIKDDLVTAAAAAKTQQIQDRLISAMASDWIAYHNATSQTTSPTTLPATSVGSAAYNTFDYLSKLAEQVQKDTGVLPSVVNVADKWQTLESLGQLGAISQSFVEGSNPPASMPQYLMHVTAPLLPPENRSSSSALQLLEPSRPFIDPSDTVYLVRVSAADPAHKPASIAEVQSDVRDDFISRQAYEMAKQDAQQLLDRARGQGLDAAVAGKGIIKVGPITTRQTAEIAGLNLDDAAVKSFVTQAFSLLVSPTTQPAASSAAHPPTMQTSATLAGATTQPSLKNAIGLITLPQDGRAIVAQLTNVQAAWTEHSRPMEEAQVALMQKYMEMAQFAKTWYDFDSVTKRLNYVPIKQKNQDESSTPPPQPQAPVF